MCGIAGFLGAPRPDEATVTASLAAALAHRGPDDQGIQGIDVTGGRRAMFIHRRLAIIDLSPLGKQPMHDPASGNWITFNGEIYNFESVRADLQHGEVFRSKSDTEVMLRLYARDGVGMLDRIQGMFAFALWDAQRQRMLLAVDPLGIKPLYWAHGPDGAFCFASEVQALLGARLVERRLDPTGMAGYLSYGAVQGPATMVAGVRALQAGSYLYVDADGTVDGPRHYWRPAFCSAPLDGRARTEVVDELSHLLRSVTREHLIADVPVAVFLSGGIDSTALASFAAPASPGLKSFSVSFTEGEFSEAEYSQATARRLALDHQELVLTPDELLRRLPDALAAADQPSIDGTNVFVLSRMVREAGVKVALSGQGGDEVFGGYSTFRDVSNGLAWRRRLAVVPDWSWRASARLWNAARAGSRGLPDKIGQFLGNGGGVIETCLLLRQLLPPSTVRELFHSYAGSDLGIPPELADEFERGTANLDPINAVSFLELRGYLGQTLLRDGDVMSMAHGLEVRVPYLDRRLVDFVAALPGSLKMERNRPKPLLLDAARGGVDPHIWARPKQGFTFPWEHWLRGPLKPLGDAAFADRATFEGIGIDATKAAELWAGFQARTPGITWPRVWALIVLQDWTTRWGVAV